MKKTSNFLLFLFCFVFQHIKDAFSHKEATNRLRGRTKLIRLLMELHEIEEKSICLHATPFISLKTAGLHCGINRAFWPHLGNEASS